jgi:hypothetical protein
LPAISQAFGSILRIIIFKMFPWIEFSKLALSQLLHNAEVFILVQLFCCFLQLHRLRDTDLPYDKTQTLIFKE